jgi:predicted GIY-YIG superfamily endonuclease
MWRRNHWHDPADSEQGSVYLLHFEQPYKHAQHYLGFAHEGKLEERIDAHRLGRGSRLMKVVKAAGITWSVARVWERSNRYEERQLKNQGGLARQCPRCKEQRKAA